MATTTTALDEVIALLPAQDMYTITGHSGTTLTDAMLLWYGKAVLAFRWCAAQLFPAHRT